MSAVDPHLHVHQAAGRPPAAKPAPSSQERRKGDPVAPVELLIGYLDEILEELRETRADLDKPPVYDSRGYQRLTLAQVGEVARPDFARRGGPRIAKVTFQAEGGSVRWRDDGVSPSTTEGFLLAAGQTMTDYDVEPINLAFAAVTAGVTVHVAAYSNRR